MQLNVQREQDMATSVFVERMRQRGIRPKLRIDLVPFTHTLSRVVQACTTRWQDQLNPNESIRLFFDGDEIVDHSTTLEMLHRQGGSHRANDKWLLTLTYAMCSNHHAPLSAEGKQDCDGKSATISCGATSVLTVAHPAADLPDTFQSAVEANSPLVPLSLWHEQAAQAKHSGGDSASVASTCEIMEFEDASQTAGGTAKGNEHQDSPVNAVTSPGAGFDESTCCWGACLQGTKAKCTPGFVAASGHFKNKLCDTCRSGICVSADRIRAVSPELARSLVTTTNVGHGFYTQSLDEFGDAKFRIVNNTKHCSGPMLACFLSAPPPLAWLPLPPEWLSTDKQHLWLHFAYGTLRPFTGRPYGTLRPFTGRSVITGSLSMSGQFAAAENAQAVPLITHSSPTGRIKRPRTSERRH